jgi:uncharacterized protein (DUF2236 family)
MAYPNTRTGSTPSLGAAIARPVKQAIARQVVAIFNDRKRGEKPVLRSTNALFSPSAVTWRVHQDVGSMMVGGVTSLLLQMLHPAVLAGVWDHSKFRSDMQGRLRRTARFIATTTYAERADAEAAIARVRAIHGHVSGTLPNSQPYSANDPALLAWVHVTETTSFLNAWIRYGEPGMSGADQDRYFAETAMIGTALGADPVPRSSMEARTILRQLRASLRVDARTREMSRLLLTQRPSAPLMSPVQDLMMRASIDLLPGWAQRMHNLDSPLLARPLVRASTYGLSQTLRWAFT